jgi:hypothetical protein
LTACARMDVGIDIATQMARQTKRTKRYPGLLMEASAAHRGAVVSKMVSESGTLIAQSQWHHW